MITGLLKSAVFSVKFRSFTWEVLLKIVKHMLRCYSFRRGFLLEHTVRKMDLILRSIEQRPQMQLSLARRFKLQLLRR
jgi:hypothetical protein